MLKLNASFSKKVPAEQEYSSKGYSATIEVELPDGLNKEQLSQKIHETFQMVEASVESEINGAFVAAQGQTPQLTMRQAANPQTPSSQPSTRRGNGGSGNPSRASAKQIKFLLDIARRTNTDIRPILHGMGVDAPESLTKQQCSALIDQLNGIGKAA